MRHRLYRLTVVLLSACSVLCVRAGIGFDHREHDFGQLLWKSHAQLTLTVTNRSASSAAISRVESSNSALSCQWPVEIIPAGGKVQLSISLDAHMLGHFTHALYLYTEGGRRLRCCC